MHSTTRRSRKVITTVAVLAVAGAAVAGCGSSNDSSSKAASSAKMTSSTKMKADAKMQADAKMKADAKMAKVSGAMHDTAGDGTTSLKSTIAYDRAAGTATLPLHAGTTKAGDAVSYIITESSDQADAEKLGVNYAPKLAKALGSKAVMQATGDVDALVFDAGVDFSAKRVVQPSAQGFPPAKAVPGANAAPGYSPLVTTGDGIVRNVAQVANATGQNDSVLKLDAAARTVQLAAFTGFGNGRAILYIRTEGSVGLLAAIEGTTLAPSLNSLPGLASSAADSPREAIVPIVNGQRGKDNPQRQGLQSALLGEGSPQNVVESLPGDPNYSPLWDVAPAAWNDSTVAAGKQTLLKSVPEIARLAKSGTLVSGVPTGTADATLGGIKAAGFVSDCSVIAVY